MNMRWHIFSPVQAESDGDRGLSRRRVRFEQGGDLSDGFDIWADLP
jgi:hypothetical protein